MAAKQQSVKLTTYRFVAMLKLSVERGVKNNGLLLTGIFLHTSAAGAQAFLRAGLAEVEIVT